MAQADSTSSSDAFLARWSHAAASERANAQLFLTELADLLGVPRPENSRASGYSFEFPLKIPTGPGITTDGRIDLYRRGCFVLEAKQFAAPKIEQSDLALAALASGAESAEKRKSGPIRDSAAWDDAMWRAKSQAERYARHLPSDEPPAPFLLVVEWQAVRATALVHAHAPRHDPSRRLNWCSVCLSDYPSPLKAPFTSSRDLRFSSASTCRPSLRCAHRAI